MRASVVFTGSNATIFFESSLIELASGRSYGICTCRDVRSEMHVHMLALCFVLYVVRPSQIIRQ